MANINAPAGLVPVRYLNGSKWNGQVRTYYIASTDPNAFAIGDPLVLSGDGDTNGVAGVTLATAGVDHPVLGALAGVSSVGAAGNYGAAGSTGPTNPNTIVVPATKLVGYYVLVFDDPNIIYEMQEDSLGANLAASDIGTNVNLVSGVNNGFISGWMLDSNSTGTGAGLQAKLLQKAQRSDVAIGQYCRWDVLINNHQYRTGITGV